MVAIRAVWGDREADHSLMIQTCSHTGITVLTRYR